ncbi:hypothetical protein [Aeromonas sobria]
MVKVVQAESFNTASVDVSGSNNQAYIYQGAGSN